MRDLDVSVIKEIFNKKTGESEKKKEPVKEPVLPDTAKDIYGEASETGDVVPEPEKKGQSAPAPAKAPEELPEIKFPSAKKTEKPTKSQESQPREEHTIVRHDSQEMPEMKDEIKNFENAIKEMYPDGYFEKETNYPAEGSSISDHGFFSEFQKFMEGNEMSKMAPEFLDKDFLDKMKEYYLHKQEGKPHYFHTDELKEAVKRNMIELRELEKEWVMHKQRIAREEELLIQKEEAISDKAEELKYLMKQVKKREEVMKKAPEERYFYLSNGNKLKSVADLRAALRVMSDDVFNYHVTKDKNDFAEWVSAVFGAHKLAVAMAKCDSKEEMLKLLSQADEN